MPIKLIEAHIAGDDDARDEIILMHMAYATTMSRAFKKEDAAAQAYFGLVQAVKWIREGRCKNHSNITGYIIVTIKNALFNYIYHERLI